MIISEFYYITKDVGATEMLELISMCKDAYCETTLSRLKQVLLQQNTGRPGANSLMDEYQLNHKVTQRQECEVGKFHYKYYSACYIS